MRVPGEDDFCPGVKKVRPGNSRDIPGVLEKYSNTRSLLRILKELFFS